MAVSKDKQTWNCGVLSEAVTVVRRYFVRSRLAHAV